jgi:hypothetical protein
MTISANTGYNVDNTDDVYITFTPNHPLYGYSEAFDITWTALKNGVFAGSGTFTANDEVVNGDVHLTMTVTAYVTDTIVIYLSGENWMV